jgi:hypothetical protein
MRAWYNVDAALRESIDRLNNQQLVDLGTRIRKSLKRYRQRQAALSRIRVALDAKETDAERERRIELEAVIALDRDFPEIPYLKPESDGVPIVIENGKVSNPLPERWRRLREENLERYRVYKRIGSVEVKV